MIFNFTAFITVEDCYSGFVSYIKHLDYIVSHLLLALVPYVLHFQ